MDVALRKFQGTEVMRAWNQICSAYWKARKDKPDRKYLVVSDRNPELFEKVEKLILEQMEKDNAKEKTR